jgi:hypothetical protein
MGIEQLVEAYKGNPAPLEEKVQKAQQGQAPGEIPADLEEAIALQKIANLKQGAQNQQAMQAGGAQLSVVEKLRQILASADQRQQGQPPMMPQGGQPQMPQGAPQGQPVMAARGGSIDQLMSNLGRHYAGGGIVAFDNGGDVEGKAPLRPYPLSEQGADWEARRQAEREEQEINKKDAEVLKLLAASVEASPAEKAIKAVEPYKGPRQVTQRELAEEFNRKRFAQQAEDAKKPEDEMLKLVKMPFQAAGRGIMGALKSLYGQQMPGEMPEQAGADQNMGEAIMQASRNREAAQDNRPIAIGTEAQRSLPSISGKGLPAAAVLTGQGGAGGNAGKVGGAGVSSGVDKGSMPGGLAGLPSVGVGRDYERRMLAENQNFNPEAYKQKFLQEVGQKDLSIYDEMAAELKARRDRLAEPKPGFDALMEYLSQIEGGRNWMESGRKGSANLTALKKERQALRDTLTEKIIETGGKKKEAEYTEKLGLFNLTKAEKDRVGTESRELAKSLGLSEDKEAELRQSMAIEVMKIKANKEIQGMPGAEQRFFNQMAASWLAQPENKGKSMFDAYTAFKIAGYPAAAAKGVMTRDQASDNVMKKIAYDSPIRNDLMNEARDALKKAGIASPSGTQITDYLIDKEMGRANAPAASSGKVVDFNALPK